MAHCRKGGDLDLSRYSAAGFSRGASPVTETLWLIASGFLVASWLPGSSWRVGLLRLFGARIGVGVVVKPRVRVKFPWRLEVGAHSWIGEGAWIDNLAEVSVGEHSCISQGAYLCTGNHDWSAPGFDLMVRPIVIGERVWVGAFARIAPGCRIGDGAVVAMASVASGDLRAWHIHSGNPAEPVRRRGTGRRSEQ